MDATIIAIPTSTNNQDNARDPEIRQVKKGNEWHFGMKLHIGVDSAFGLIHTLKTTSSNVHGHHRGRPVITRT
ncbi:transposase [Gynuella sp.]|uniref:transposase n=1 Tax=Gynuella sp. TaxID=2969146 RepID=UPI003D148DFC